jgi:4-oxalocrotonate tautomerase
MPIIDVTLFEGRDDATKRELMVEVTEVVARRLEVPRDAVTIILREVPRAHLSKGGVPFGEGPPD